MTLAWIEHVIEHNWSRVQQSITEGEQEITSRAPMVTLDSLLDNVGRADEYGEQRRRDEPESAQQILPPAKATTRQEASITNVTQATAAMAVAAINGAATATTDMLMWFLTGTGRPGSTDIEERGQPTEPSVRTVRVGNLSAALIEEAGTSGETLAITHDRELIGIMVPVTTGLIEYLVEQNLTRVLYNISWGEKEVATEKPFATLDQVTSERTVKAPSSATATEKKKPRRSVPARERR